MKPRICFNCKNKFIGKSLFQKYCSNCHNSMKGGQNNMAKKETVVEKSEIISKHNDKVKDRIMFAEKTLEYVKNTLKVPKEELQKVLSRVYQLGKKQ